jgi:uncharacterized membrane protein
MNAFFFVPLWGFIGPGFWIVVIGLVALGTRGARTTASGGARPAVRLLEERYARGDMTREDYIERRAVLDGTSPGASR